MRVFPLLTGAAVLAAAGVQAQVDASETLMPLAQPRTLEFSTDEGTWMSLDVTPDGRSIVFDLLGDLYRVPIEGGAAQRITSGSGFDAQPRVSPDGKWLAFTSDRGGDDQLWIARIDGSDARALSPSKVFGLSPTWSPDSRYVIATVNGGITLFHIDGGSGVEVDLKRLSSIPMLPVPERPEATGPVMSRDGSYLYFARLIGMKSQMTSLDWQIHRRNMTTGEVDVITNRLGGAFRPALAPDGRRLVYATHYESKTGLRVLDLVSGEDRWLIYPVQQDLMEDLAKDTLDIVPGYAITPDGLSLIAAIDNKIQRVDLQTGRAEIIPFTAQVSTVIGPKLDAPYSLEQGPVRARLVQNPRSSPDGKQVAFSALSKLYVMRWPDGTPQRLTRDSAWEYRPAWSPDGRWIAYVTWGQEGGHIWKMRADGSGKPQRLTAHPDFYTDPVFSPDGARIVALRGSAYARRQSYFPDSMLWEMKLDVVWLPAQGGETHLIAPGAQWRGPHFTADPQRVYVYAYDTGNVVSMRFDGSDRRTHIRLAASPSNSVAQYKTALVSPDGLWVAAKLENQLHVMPLPPVGGEGADANLSAPAFPMRRITDFGVDDFAWADGGKTVTWVIGATFHRRPIASVQLRPITEPAIAGADFVPLEKNAAVQSRRIEIEFQRAKPRGSLVLRHATVITMEGETVIEEGDVLVQDNRFAAIGRSGEVSVPAGTREIDMRGKFIVPGFVDTHAHWPFRGGQVLEPHAWVIAANLAYGVTTGLDVQAQTDVFAYQDMVETGEIVGQRMLTTGVGILYSNNFKSYERLRAYLQSYKENYGVHNIKSYLVGNREQRHWMVNACKELGLMPTTEGLGDLRMDLTHALDGFHGNEHSLPATPLGKDVVELFARSGTAYTPTLLVQYDRPVALDRFFEHEKVHDDEKLNRFVHHNHLDLTAKRREAWSDDREYTFGKLAEQAAKIQRAGGLIGVGGHGELQGLGYHWEMWSLGEGMQPREVLKAATIDGARIIGIAQDLGSITTGKIADLVVLDKNPLADIRNTNTVRYVMKNGELYEGDTLKQIWPKEKELPPFWWWDPPTQTAAQY